MHENELVTATNAIPEPRFAIRAKNEARRGVGIVGAPMCSGWAWFDA